MACTSATRLSVDSLLVGLLTVWLLSSGSRRTYLFGRYGPAAAAILLTFLADKGDHRSRDAGAQCSPTRGFYISVRCEHVFKPPYIDAQTPRLGLRIFDVGINSDRAATLSRCNFFVTGVDLHAIGVDDVYFFFTERSCQRNRERHIHHRGFILEDGSYFTDGSDPHRPGLGLRFRQRSGAQRPR